jgi:hypothetical protein
MGEGLERLRRAKKIWMVWEETKQSGEDVAEGVDLISSSHVRDT